jgi:hypothetical protein
MSGCPLLLDALADLPRKILYHLLPLAHKTHVGQRNLAPSLEPDPSHLESILAYTKLVLTLKA